MSGQLRPGGLALVIKSTDPREVGKCVSIIHHVKDGDTVKIPGREIRISGLSESGVWLVHGDVEWLNKGQLIAKGRCIFPPTHLMPIDESDPDLVKQNIEREVKA